MNTKFLPTPNTVTPPRIFELTNKLTIGSAVCYTEGIVASIMVLVPQNHWYYIAATLLAFAIWVAFWRFRDNKMGADVGDLIFLELIVHSIATVLYFAGHMTNDKLHGYWYIFTCISALKILRVYFWQSSATQRYGWCRFGFMTRHHAKYYAHSRTSTPNTMVLSELVAMLVVSIIFSACYHLLSDAGRLVVGWAVPLTFEFMNGPVQLRGMAMLQNLLAVSSQRAADDAAEIVRLKQELVAKEKQLAADDDPTISAIVATMRTTTPRMREHVLLYARNVAKQFPATPAEEK